LNSIKCHALPGIYESTGGFRDEIDVKIVRAFYFLKVLNIGLKGGCGGMLK
jgi:hypothetical protein